MKPQKYGMLHLAATALSAVGVLSLLLVSTYAWFTSNKRVEADTVSVRSGTQEMELGISSSAGGPFAEEADIHQLNPETTALLPVSTADLEHFYRSAGLENGMAVSFALTEEDYYHGQVFLQATGDGMPEGTKVDIYLDDLGIVVDEPGDQAGLMKNAARVGLVVTGASDTVEPLIFNLSKEHNGGEDTYANTILGGQMQEGDVVLGGSGTPEFVKDPSIEPETYMIGENGTLPEKPLFTMDLNTVVTLDVYYYLEGCDTDCTKAIRTTETKTSEMSIQLPFYGVMAEESAG